MSEGKFIVFEGLDGSGKSTMSRFCCTYLNDNTIRNIWTREPGGSSVAEQIRRLLLDPQNDMDKDTETMLFFAARSHHLQYTIKPHKADGIAVICDRFVDSTLAYQSESVKQMWDLQEWAYNLPWMIRPDYVFYMRISPEIAFERMRFNNATNGEFGNGVDDRIEQSFKQRVNNMYAVYEELNSEYDHYIEIDAEQNLDGVRSQIIHHLNTIFFSLG